MTELNREARIDDYLGERESYLAERLVDIEDELAQVKADRERVTQRVCRETEENAELRAKLADYENRITWHTNCGEHARLLDHVYAADVTIDRLRQWAQATDQGKAAAQVLSIINEEGDTK